jgi:RNA-binding protein YhbY
MKYFMFSRTSTHLILEIIMKYQTTEPETVQTIYNNHYTNGNGRTVKDIRSIINKLHLVGLLQEKNQKIISKIRANNLDTSKGGIKDEVISLLRRLESRGLIIVPFLQAIKEKEGKQTRIIIEATQENLTAKGVDTKIGSDSCAAMKNFLAYLLLLTNGKGRYYFTSFGNLITSQLDI